MTPFARNNLPTPRTDAWRDLDGSRGDWYGLLASHDKLEREVAELREALGKLRQQCEGTGFRGVNGLWVVGQIDAMLKSLPAQGDS